MVEEVVSLGTIPRRTREDIEAQRLLLKEMIEEREEEAERDGADSDDDDDGDSHDDDDDDSSEEEEKSKNKSRRKKKDSNGSESDYNPKEDIRWEKNDRIRDRQRKMKAKFQRLRKERLEKKKRLEGK